LFAIIEATCYSLHSNFHYQLHTVPYESSRHQSIPCSQFVRVLYVTQPPSPYASQNKFKVCWWFSSTSHAVWCVLTQVFLSCMNTSYRKHLQEHFLPNTTIHHHRKTTQNDLSSTSHTHVFLSSSIKADNISDQISFSGLRPKYNNLIPHKHRVRAS